MGRKVLITMAVTNDVATDQRVLRIADTLSNEGHIVTVVCRKLPNRPQLPTLPFKVKYKKIWAKKGFAFYASFNIALFFDLLFSNVDIITANDLDTLPACALVAALKRKPLLYDSHELFTELPELSGRTITKSIWKQFEKLFIKKAHAVSTVSNSIADEFTAMYNISSVVIRNVPHYKSGLSYVKKQDYPKTKRLLYQGSLNSGRGLEQMIGAMIFLTDYHLTIAGTGYLEKALKQMVVDLDLSGKVTFTGLLSPDDLYTLTLSAHLGLSLEENSCKNYEYALPNKLFDYIQARVPVLTSNLPEIAKIVERYKVGTTVNVKESHELALIVKNIFEHDQLLKVWKNNCNIAASDLCWEKERSKLIDMYNSLIPLRCN